MHIPAWGLSPIHFLLAPSMELLKTPLRKQCMLSHPQKQEQTPTQPQTPRAVLLNQVRAVFAGWTEPVWLLH